MADLHLKLSHLILPFSTGLRGSAEEACNPAAGWEKGQVENQVSFIRRNMFTPKLRFASLEELNQHLEARCEALAKRPQPVTQTS